ncbi:MAG: metal-dependent transcriptional regulator [Acidobacteriaceae bacterium]|nr:metal-dependent transcriptional regulator [Acidobacteriaceae bacterium]MBV9781950.1 metal-dependent transcriptional regulator [Acidobacteriaceae bacterium]
MPSKSRIKGHTESADDYLKAILELSGPEDQRVASNALAIHLGIRAASVTGMLQKLSTDKPALVKYQKHHGARLTTAGRKRALEVLRHHRLLERFLHDFLDYGWDEVHEEAERLEHFISEKLEDKIAAKLGDPLLDPHGHVIPERNGAFSARDEVNLLNWACGVPALISSVSDRDASDLRAIERLGLRPGTSVVVEAGVRNASLLVRIGGQNSTIRLGQHLAAQIFVVARTPQASAA